LNRERNKTYIPKHADSVIAIAFFVGCFAYTFIVIKPQLTYHALGRLTPNTPFSTGLDNLLQSIHHPAGLLNYIAAFTAHCFSFSLLATTIITAISLALYLATRLILRNSRPAGLLSITAFIPALLVLATYTRYANQTRDFLAIILATFSFAASNHFTNRNLLTRLSIFICLFICLFITALPAAFIFAALYSLSALLTKKSRLTGLAVLIASASVYFLTSRHLEIPIVFSTLQTPSTLYPDKSLVYPISAIYIFFSLITATASLFPSSSTKRPQKASAHSSNKAMMTLSLKVVLLLLTSVWLLWANQSPKKKRLLLINHFAGNKQWSRTLQAARKHPPSPGNFLEIHDINRALYYSGTLCEDMFNYPQNPDSLLLNIEAPDVWSEIYHRRVTIMYELGYPSLAEKFAYELLVYNDHTPFTLEMLARIYIAKQNPDTARVFLNALAKQPFCKKRAERIISDLQNGSFKDVIASNSVADIDIIDFAFRADEFFTVLIRRNPKNKMACEYMMAYYMLTKQLDKLAANISLINNCGYKTFPTNCAQALIVYKLHRNKDFPLESLPIDPEQISYGMNFFKSLARRDPVTNQKLRTQYAGTYYNYYTFTNR